MASKEGKSGKGSQKKDAADAEARQQQPEPSAATAPDQSIESAPATSGKRRKAKSPTTKEPAPVALTSTPASPTSVSAKPTKRQSAARARSGTRVDRRTTTRRKPTKSHPPEIEVITPEQVDVPAPLTAAPAPSSTADFMEAAFGPKSHLPEQLLGNIERIEALTQRLVAALATRDIKDPGVEGPGPDLYATAATAWVKLMTEQPERVIGRQVSYWGDTLKHFAEAQAAFARGSFRAPPDDGPKDRRFANPLWESHPFFNFVKRQYQINADAVRKAAADLSVPDGIDRRRIDWFTRQIIDMMSPTNFLATNPDALEKAVATEGESLVRGLENLVRDVEQHGGEMIVSLADRNAFRVGEDIATTPGAVVARADLYELVQYKPVTEQVHALPIVIFPPWINKFYILDLKPQNSLIRWLVGQGHSVFVVSWKNPDAAYADKGMEDYVSAYLDVMDQVLAQTGQEKLNVVGYCIAGTTLALTLALLKQRGDERVNAATFFTTLTDFSEQGEFTAFLQEDFVSGIEAELERTGVLGAQLMTRTFSFLRANDLIWAPAIRSYMLGEPPAAFDLLFWNGDGTNLPGRMAREYLRGLCQRNAFAVEGFELFGQKLNLDEVTVPLCAIACETDHIAPAADSWRGIAMMGSADKTFILAESGHIAGIINPPGKEKYGHYTSQDAVAGPFEAWRGAATFRKGSWWPSWGEWLAGRSGPMVPARDPGEGLVPAPGTYVHERV